MSAFALSGANTSSTSQAAHSTNSQDQLVRRNVLRAQEMRKTILDGDFDLRKVGDLARQIYLDGLECITAEVANRSILAEELTPVVVSLNEVSVCGQIQHNLHVLIPLLKAHRTMTELTWIQCWKSRNQPTYKSDQETIFTIVKSLKSVLPRVAKVEQGCFLSPVGARYELSCLKQAAKCLNPKDAIWKQYFTALAEGINAAAKLEIGAFLTAISTISDLTEKKWVAKWYKELYPLEWKATNVINVAMFQRDIGPHLEAFTQNGDKHTIGLVKILTVIFQNQNSDSAVKERAFEELIKLVKIKPKYSVLEALEDPNHVFRKLMRKPDRYAETRSFAALALLDLASKPENKIFQTKVKDAIAEWNHKTKDKTSRKYVDEKREAEVQYKGFKHQSNLTFEERLHELNELLEEAALGPSKGDTPLSIDRIQDELDALETIILANAYEKVQNDELKFFAELAPILNRW